jgi:uncharacterized membrane protein
MGLALLVLGLVLFLGPHVLVSRRGARAALVARIGEGPYKGLFAIVSILGLYFIGKGFALYRDAGMIDIWDPPEWTRHITVALMWPAVVFVTAAYIPGDLGSMIIFISVLAWAVYDRITLKRRSDPGAPPIPIGGRRNDIAAVIVGTILYFALALVFHPLVIGKSVLLFGPRALGT